MAHRKLAIFSKYFLCFSVCAYGCFVFFSGGAHQRWGRHQRCHNKWLIERERVGMAIAIRMYMGFGCGDRLAVRLIDALFVAPSAPDASDTHLAALCCCFWHLYASTQLSKDLPNNSINGRPKRTSMGCLQHAVIFIAVTHDACGPVADPRSQIQRPYPGSQIPCPFPVSVSDAWSSLVFHGCHTYCPCPMAIINCSLNLRRALGWDANFRQWS